MVQCAKCGYEWVSSSDKLLVTCSNCGRKTKNTPGGKEDERKKVL